MLHSQQQQKRLLLDYIQQSYYSAVEGQGPVDICVVVLSGDITGNSFTISYSTSDGQAEGKVFLILYYHMFIS